VCGRIAGFYRRRPTDKIGKRQLRTPKFFASKELSIQHLLIKKKQSAKGLLESRLDS